MVPVDIELLVVPGCPHEDTAAELIKSAVAGTYVRDATVRRTVIDSEQQARRRGFTGSPTILLNGADPFADPQSTTALACRIYTTPDGPAGVPPLADLRRALKVAASRSA